MNKLLKALKPHLKSLKNNQSGFTFVELLVVIVIMAVLVAGTANYLFSQGGSKARDIERKNDMKQVAALLEQFVSSYGEPPNGQVKNRTITKKYSDCASINNFAELMICFKTLKYAEGEGLVKLAEDPKQANPNNDGKIYQYQYGSDSNGWKVCALLENQTDPDLNDNYAGTGEFGDEWDRTYCLISSNRKLKDIGAVTAGSIDFDVLEQ